ncbi:MAG: M56 family metallopeptidase [Planctomycetota bacterium]
MPASLLNLAATQLGQVTIVLAVVALLHRVLADRAPRLMAGLWTVAAIKAVTPPLVASPLGLFSWAQASGVAAAAPVSGPVVIDWTGGGEGWVSFWLTTAVAVWLTGALLMTGATLLERRRLQRLLSRDTIPADDPLHRYVVGLAERYRLCPPHAVVVSKDELGPAIAGVRRPTVILPSRLVTDQDPSVLRPILLHELVHTTRRDTLSAWLLTAVRVVWWFHPLAWWSAKLAEGLVERCVDLTVTRELQTSLADYGRSLLRVLELRAELSPRSQLASLRPCQITTDRINFLRTTDTASRRLASSNWIGAVGRWCVCGVAAAVLLPALPVDALSARCEPGVPCSAAAEAARPIASPDAA